MLTDATPSNYNYALRKWTASGSIIRGKHFPAKRCYCSFQMPQKEIILTVQIILQDQNFYFNKKTFFVFFFWDVLCTLSVGNTYNICLVTALPTWDDVDVEAISCCLCGVAIYLMNETGILLANIKVSGVPTPNPCLYIFKVCKLNSTLFYKCRTN